MAQVQPKQRGRWSRRLAVRVLGPLLAVALVGAWADLELHAAQARAEARLATAGVAVTARIHALLDRFAAAGAHFTAGRMSPASQIDATAALLRMEASLQPARSIFLYDGSGRFVAATLPLLPEDVDVSQQSWFRAAARHRDGPVLSPIASAPFGQGSGVLITQTFSGTDNVIARVFSGFVTWQALQELLSPPGVAAGTAVRLLEGETGRSLLQFATPSEAAHRFLTSAIAWAGWSPRVSAQAVLPGGLVWRADADALSAVTEGDWATVGWHAAVVATVCFALLWWTNRKPRERRRPEVAQPEVGAAWPPKATASDTESPPEMEWVWEVDARGRLVGVAGNAPATVAAAVGKNLIGMVAEDEPAQRLREAIDTRQPVRRMELTLALPGGQTRRSLRVCMSGRAVAETGGFWGTAREIDPAGPLQDAAD